MREQKRKEVIEYTQRLLVTTKTLHMDVGSLAVPKVAENGEISLEDFSPNDILTWARVLLIEIPSEPGTCSNCTPIWSLSDIGKEIRDAIVNISQQTLFKEE